LPDRIFLRKLRTQVRKLYLVYYRGLAAAGIEALLELFWPKLRVLDFDLFNGQKATAESPAAAQKNWNSSVKPEEMIDISTYKC